MPFYNILPWYSDSTTAPKHYNTRNRNQTLNWNASDSEQLYHKNIQDSSKQALLEKYKRLDYIEYRYNNHGFRSETFDERPAGLALGCSFTEGIGLHIKDAWPSVLSNMLGDIHVWNLGIGGSAFDTVFRILDYYLLKFNPQFVCILIPPIARMEYCDISGRFPVISPTSTVEHQQFAKEWLTQEKNSIYNRKKNTLAIKQLCQEANVPVFFDYAESYYNCPNKDYARDLLHYGSNVQKHIAQQFYNKLNKDNGI